MAEYPHNPDIPQWYVFVERLNSGYIDLTVGDGTNSSVGIRLSVKETEDLSEALSGRYVYAIISSSTDHRLHQSIINQITMDDVPEEDMLHYEP